MDISKAISDVQKIYQEIEAETQFFKQVTGLNCVAGCGDCCNRFEPYITVLEGLVFIDYFSQNPNIYERFIHRPLQHENEILCPFYNINQDYHCSIYKARPMICRLYSFSGKKDPHGVSFQPCAKIQEFFPKEVALAHLLLKESLTIPIYTEIYAKLCSIDFILATDFHPLTRSIEIALEQKNSIADEYYQEQQKKLGQNIKIPFAQFVRNHLIHQGFPYTIPSQKK